MSASGGHGSQRPSDVRPDLRPSWSASDRRIPRRVVRPLQAFLSQETAAGVLLVAAAVLALGWANSPWASAYERLWSTPMSIRLGSLTIAEDLRG